MQSCRSIISGLLFSLVFLFAGSLQAAEGLIEEVTFQETADGGESVVFRLNGPHLPSAFGMTGEKPRAVFDFKDTDLARGVPVLIPAEGRLIQQIRLGRHSDKVRAVIDLVPGVKTEFDQAFDEKENLLTIRLAGAGSPDKPEKKTEPAAAVKEEATPEKVEEVAEVPAPAQDKESPAEVEAVKEEVSTAPADSGQPQKPEPSEPQKKAEKAAEKAAVPEKEASAEKSGPLPDPLLSSVTFETTPNKGEMVLFRLNGFYPPTVSGKEEGIPRVICDFAGTRLGDEVAKEQAIDGTFVRQIRVQQLEEGDLVRVVLNLVPNKNYDLQQVFFKEDSLFVIIVNSYDTISETAQEKK